MVPQTKPNKPSLGDLPDRLLAVEVDIGWHRMIGWGIAAAYATVFGVVLSWLLIWYIPNSLNEQIPADFKEKFGVMQADIRTLKEQSNRLMDQLNRLTPSAINQLLVAPQPKSAPPLKSRLEQANGIVDAALRIEMPANPQLLQLARYKVRDIVRHSSRSPKLQKLAMSTASRIEGYDVFSRAIIGGNRPIPFVSAGFRPPQAPTILEGFGIECTHSTAQFIGGTPQDANNAVVIDVSITGCSQQLAHFKWIRSHFEKATIQYHGGPVSLSSTTFKDCKFDFGNDPQSRVVLLAIVNSRGAPVSLFIE